MIHLRKATARDARAIRALIWRVGINPTQLDWRRFVVAVDEQDTVIGCGQVKPHGDGSRELASIAVVPECQGQGIGRMIIERLLDETRLPLYLTCRAAMQEYYQRFGFQPAAYDRMPAYFKRIDRAASLLRRLFPRLNELRIMVKTA